MLYAQLGDRLARTEGGGLWGQAATLLWQQQQQLHDARAAGCGSYSRMGLLGVGLGIIPIGPNAGAAVESVHETHYYLVPLQ